MKTVIIVIILVLIIWTVGSYFFSKVEELSYGVLEEKDGYEIRKYEPYISAETKVTGTYSQALNEGFRILAGYIFGDNQGSSKIAMTAPVTEEEIDVTKIAMTAPVTVDTEGVERTISFSMPSEYSLETLPKPNDERVQIVSVPEKTFAVRKFGWYRSESLVEKQKEKLLEFLDRDGISYEGSVRYAGYNAPFTPPWLIRNEVMVEILK